MLTKYEEEEKNEKQNDGMMHKGDIVTTPTFFTGEFSSVVMEEPVELHIDYAREITLNSNVWHRYVRQINDTIEQINAIPDEVRNVRITTQPRVIVPRPDEPDITYDRPPTGVEREISGNIYRDMYGDIPF